MRLAVLDDASGRSLGSFVKATTERGAIVDTEGWGGYNGLSGLGFGHRPRTPERRGGGRGALPATRTSRYLEPQGLAARTHRWASTEHLSAYLDEYVFRHNRRRTPHTAFQTLLGLSAAHGPSTYREIIDELPRAA